MAVDWWSYGIIVFEVRKKESFQNTIVLESNVFFCLSQMLTGDTLFPSQDIEEDLQDEILNMDLDFPDYLETNEVF